MTCKGNQSELQGKPAAQPHCRLLRLRLQQSLMSLEAHSDVLGGAGGGNASYAQGGCQLEPEDEEAIAPAINVAEIQVIEVTTDSSGSDSDPSADFRFRPRCKYTVKLQSEIYDFCYRVCSSLLPLCCSSVRLPVTPSQALLTYPLQTRSGQRDEVYPTTRVTWSNETEPCPRLSVRFPLKWLTLSPEG